MDPELAMRCARCGAAESMRCVACAVRCGGGTTPQSRGEGAESGAPSAPGRQPAGRRRTAARPDLVVAMTVVGLGRARRGMCGVWSEELRSGRIQVVFYM
jgi:hypothetical protein